MAIIFSRATGQPVVRLDSEEMLQEWLRYAALEMEMVEVRYLSRGSEREEK